ncbi:MAG: hypothetical protein K2X39_00265, partial [Silvanigrellaceae bacterium]|nr:hypothetical protein [Silvanigrellaceae bacterium]
MQKKINQNQGYLSNNPLFLKKEIIPKKAPLPAPSIEEQNSHDFPTKASVMERIRNKKTQQIEPDFNQYRPIGSRIDQLLPEIRLDHYLAQKFPFHNRMEWKERIVAKEILVEHQVKNASRAKEQKPHLNIAKATYRLKKNDQIWIYQTPSSSQAAPKEFGAEVDVLYDNGDICAFT